MGGYFRIAATMGVLSLTALSVEAQLSFQGLGNLGDTYNRPLAISEDGSTVYGVSGTGAGAQGYAWSASTGMGATGNPGAVDIANDGAAWITSVFNPGTFTTTFHYHTGSSSESLGSITGGIVSGDGSTVAGRNGTQAFRKPAFAPTSEVLAGVGGTASYVNEMSSDGSVAAGYSSNAGGYSQLATAWMADGIAVSLGDLAGGADLSYANSVSSNGNYIVGRGSSDRSSYEGFRWTEAGGMVALGGLQDDPTFLSDALDVADNGNVVGRATGANGSTLVFWDHWGNIYNLEALIQDTIAGWLDPFYAPPFLRSLRISADGNSIIGFGLKSAGVYESWIVTGVQDYIDAQLIPEPGTIGLICTAMLLGLGIIRKRKQKQP